MLLRQMRCAFILLIALHCGAMAAESLSSRWLPVSFAEMDGISRYLWVPSSCLSVCLSICLSGSIAHL
jgi:hypothetical protein